MSLLHQVALTFIKGVGSTSSRLLLSYFGDAEAVFQASHGKLMKVPGISKVRVGQMDFDTALRLAEQELRLIEQNGIEPLFLTDTHYPKRLKNCDDAPVLLYSKGNADLNMPKVVSIVGTRKATDYGKQLCQQLIEELKQYDVLIVSGLAMGIDGAAHRESLKWNVPNVGVLGHGLDTMYPVSHRSVAEKMLQMAGY